MSANDMFRLSDGTELTKEQLLSILNSSEAKDIFKKDREERINAWCKETFEKLGTKNSLALFQPLFTFVEHIKWDVLNEEDQTLCKEAMERLLVIFDSEDQPLLSDDGYEGINQELYNELGRK